MWPWERKAYERGLSEGREVGEQALHQVDIQLNEAIDKERKFADGLVELAVDRERKAADARVEEQYRQLGQLLLEARHEIPDDSPLHARIKKVLDGSGGIIDAQMRRIAKIVPDAVKPLKPK